MLFRIDALRTSNASTLLVTGLLTACGGGGGGGNAEDSAPSGGELTTGVLAPIAISGIEYTTASESGVTNAEGEFTYRVGETIEFQWNGQVLGEVAGTATITLFQLTGADQLSDINEVDAALGTSGHPYTSALNMTRLLHSLDSDQDSSNGIELADVAKVAPLLSATNANPVNFSLAARVFANSPSVRSLMREADRTLMPLEVVLASQYRASQTALFDGDVRLSRPISNTFEDFQSGTATSFRSEYQYDANGNYTAFRTFDADGDLASSENFRYGAAGHLISSRSEALSDSQTEPLFTSMRTFTRDESGNTVTLLTEIFGLTPTSLRTDSTFNQRGRIVRQEVDEGNDGSIDRTLDAEYAPDDQITRLSIDDDGDGIDDQTTSNTYNNQGQLVRSVFEGPGSLDSTRPVLPPPLGLSPVVEFDPTSPYPVSAAGSAWMPVEPQDLVFRDTRFEWNERGYLVRRTVDTDRDGIANEITTFVYEADNLVTWSYDADADGQFESSARYAYSNTGQLSEVTEVIEQFGFTSKQQRAVFYDDQGRYERIRGSFNGDASTEFEQQYRYDQYGNLEAQTFYDASDNISLQQTILWEPTYRLDNPR